jgi:hypothetical protein
MKFGNEDNKMKASDALLMWVKNQTHGYKNAEVKDFQHSFKNGMVLCALLHKFRPKLIGDYDKLVPANFEANLKLAFKAAKEYFDLDEYLTPQEIQKLDDKVCRSPTAFSLSCSSFPFGFIIVCGFSSVGALTCLAMMWWWLCSRWWCM